MKVCCLVGLELVRGCLNSAMRASVFGTPSIVCHDLRKSWAA